MSQPCNCGCCSGVAVLTPLTVYNRPGLKALRYRIGTYASFFETMKARLSSPDFVNDAGGLPLSALTTRDPSDPAIALLDAWAIVADVLTFYQERIANEGYLHTAIEQQSILNLAQLVGYTPQPGVSASVYLAYTVEQGTETAIPAGSKVQSIPGAGELPQTFETSQPLDAQGSWSNLAPRVTRPQVLSSNMAQVYVAGVSPNLKPNDPVLIVASPPKPRRVQSVEVQSQQNRTLVNLQSLPENAADAAATAASAADPAAGSKTQLQSWVSEVDLVGPLSQPPADHPANSIELPRSVKTAFGMETDNTPSLLTKFKPDIEEQLYTGLRNAQVTADPTGQVHALRVQAAPFGYNAPLRPITNDAGIVIGTEEWPLVGSMSIRLVLSTQSGADTIPGATLMDSTQGAITRRTPRVLVQVANADSTSRGIFPLQTGGVKVGPWKLEITAELESSKFSFNFPELGHSYDIQPDANKDALEVRLDGPAQPIQVPVGESYTAAAVGRRTLISFQKGILIDDELAVAPTATKVINLDSVYDKIIPGSWVLIERADNGSQLPTRVVSVQKVSVTNYGMSARVTQLTLEDDWLHPKTDLMLDVARNTAVSAQSEELPLAEEPITDPVATDTIELGDLYGGLKSGRWLIVQGERTDIPNTTGVNAAELVMLANVVQGVQQIPAPAPATATTPATTPAATQDLPGDTTHSFLQLSNPLSYQYKRDTAVVYGNVITATNGETRKEILGSGDGAQELQTFSLHQAPLTYTAAPNGTGAQSTLAVTVNGVLWKEVDTLATAGPNDRVYITQTDATGKVKITFGNGRHGMRLPTGQANVVATYRSGIGSGGNSDGGQISQLATRPLGVKAVTNPIPASGGADPESANQSRQNAPTAVSALNRLVSVSDYGDFARTFAGIGKASSVSLADGHRKVVFVTIAGAEGAVIQETSELYLNLVQAFQDEGDPHLPVQVEICEFMLLVISARVKVLPDYQFDDVAPQIRSALLDRFSFDRLNLAQSIPLSQVISAIQGTAGVQYVEIDVLDTISESDTDTTASLQAKLTEIIAASGPKPEVEVPPARSDPGTGTILPAGLAFLAPDLPNTLILTEITT